MALTPPIPLHPRPRAVVVAPGANLSLTPDDVDAALSGLLPAGGGGAEAGETRDVVLVQLEIRPESALRALERGSALGALTVLNPAPAPEGWSLTPPGGGWLRSVDVLTPNETELASICGVRPDEARGREEELARSLLDGGVRGAVVVTLGERGALLVGRDGPAASIPPPDDGGRPVVDTVGAGDAFSGALSSYLSAGSGLEEACAMACGYASLSVRSRGAQDSYPRHDELPDYLRLGGGGASPDVPTDGGGRRPRRITFVTGNPNKLAEVRRMLTSEDDEASSLVIDNAALDLPELQGSPEEIAREKCAAAAESVRGAVMTEDTSLCFRALGGLPGPYIKHFLDGMGHGGLNRMLDGFDDRGAVARTIIAYSEGPGREVALFGGETEGTVVPARGDGFGWDPVFEPTGGECSRGGIEGGRTYAEMSKSEKDAISHRSRAFARFRSYLAVDAQDVEA